MDLSLPNPKTQELLAFDHEAYGPMLHRIPPPDRFHELRSLANAAGIERAGGREAGRP